MRTLGCWNTRSLEPSSLPYIILSDELLYRCLHVLSADRGTRAQQNQALACNPAYWEGGWIKLNRYAYLNYLLKNHIRDIILICYQEPGGFRTYVQHRNPGVQGRKSGDYWKGYCNFLNNTEADFIIKRLNGPSGRRKVLWFYPLHCVPYCTSIHQLLLLFFINSDHPVGLNEKRSQRHIWSCTWLVIWGHHVSMNRLTDCAPSYIRITLLSMYNGFTVAVGGLTCTMSTLVQTPGCRLSCTIWIKV